MLASPEHEIYEELARIHRLGGAAVVATVVSAGGSTPRGPGAKMLILSDGRMLGSVGGGAIESEVIGRALSLLGSREPELLAFDLDGDVGMACGGEMQVFLEPVSPGPSVLVIGGGHVGQAVARVAKNSGFSVTVVDDREDVVSRERFPIADRRLVGGTELLGRELVVNEASHVVVVTRGHKYDGEWLKEIVNLNPAYVGMIGSESKVAATFDRLLADGVTREQLDRVHAPIGIDIGAETPGEIAVSIVAEIIAVRNGITDTAMLKLKPEAKGVNRG